MILAVLTILSTLIASCFSEPNTTAPPEYIYISPDAVCSLSNMNETLNYTCDGSMDFPFETIQDGIDVAEGNTILVLQDGTYSGSGNINLEMYDGYYRIQSSNGYTNTIIDCENNGFGIAFNKGTFLLTGITIKNCNGILRELDNLPLGNGTAAPSVKNQTIGGAIWFENGHAVIRNCLLDSNSAELGAGVYASSVTLFFQNTIISNNIASNLGGGIYIYNGYVLLNSSTVVISNEATNGGGGVYIKKATVELDRSYLYNNEADNNEGNEVLCRSGAGTLINSAYLASLAIDPCDYETGDAVCYADCALTQTDFDFDYCNYVADTSSCSEDSTDSDSGDDDSGDDDSGDDDSDSSTTGGLSSDANINMIYGKCWMLVSLSFVLNFIFALC